MKKLIALGAFALLFACTPEPEPEPEPEGPSCGDVGRAICEAACDCGEAPECTVVAAGGGGAISFDDLDGCLQIFRLGCLPEEDRQPCIDAMAEAECAVDPTPGVLEEEACVPEDVNEI